MNANTEHAFIARMGHDVSIQAMTQTLSELTQPADLEALEDSFKVASNIADSTYKEQYKQLGHLIRDKKQELMGGFVV